MDTDSVEWITTNASSAVEDQQRRAESLQTRAAQVAGFAGVTVALAGPLAKSALTSLHGHPECAAAVFFIGGSIGLALAIILSVFFVLRPIKHLALSADEIDLYVNDSRFVTSKPYEIQFRTLKGYAKTVRRYELNNARKATYLKLSAYLYLYGLVSIVALAVTLGIHYATT